MQAKLRAKVAVVGVCIAACLIFAPIMNTAIHKGMLGAGMRSLFQNFLPKADLYDKLLEDPIDIDQQGKEFRYTFVHRYAGRHTFGILARKDIPIRPTESYGANFALSLDCEVNGSKILQRSTKGVLYSWGGREQGFVLLEYSVPEDLPIDDSVECRVIVDRAGPVFSKEYGIYAVYAMKQSEK